MSVYSMTGFASAVSSTPDHVGENADAAETSTGSRRQASGSVSAELRSVNSRFLDLSFKLADEFRGLEPALREMLTAAFKRGKIEFRLQPQRAADTGWPQPQPEQLHTLARLEGTVQNWLPKAGPLSVNEVLNWCRAAAPTVRLEEAALDAAGACVTALKEARQREGQQHHPSQQETRAGKAQRAQVIHRRFLRDEGQPPDGGGDDEQQDGDGARHGADVAAPSCAVERRH